MKLAFTSFAARSSALLFTSSLAVACATGTGGTGLTGGSGAGGSGAATSSSAGGSGAGGSGTGGSLIGGSGQTGSGGSELPPIIYIHTNTTLYSADPSANDLDVKLVGDVDCIGGAGEDTSLTDIAVSGSGEIWGVSKTNVYRLEILGDVVHCAQSIPMKNPADIRFYGLTFAPKGVLDPDEEVLIAGNTAGELWSVDGAGTLAQRGSLGTVPVTDGNGNSYPNSGKKWELSGDLVFVDNGGSPVGFATVRDCPNPPSTIGCNPVDTLVELDVPKLATATTGSVLKSIRGQTVRSDVCPDANDGYGGIFGITAWKDKVYGFSRGQNIGGYALALDNDKGTACVIKGFDQEWSGAGITTKAEVDIPPPK